MFTLYKFRSMRADAERGTPVWAGAKDDRVTRVGRFIRLMRLDEIPQLWNVLRGDMSFVGPASRTPVFRRAADRGDPILPAAPRREAGRHRVGTGRSIVTARPSRTRARSCGTTSTTSSTCRSSST